MAHAALELDTKNPHVGALFRTVLTSCRSKAALLLARLAADRRDAAAAPGAETRFGELFIARSWLGRAKLWAQNDKEIWAI